MIHPFRLDMTRRSFFGALGVAAAKILGCADPETTTSLQPRPYEVGSGGSGPNPGAGGMGPGTNPKTKFFFQKEIYLWANTADLRFAGGNVLVLSASGNKGVTDVEHNHIVTLDSNFGNKNDLDIPDGAPVNRFTQISSSYGVVTALDGLYEHRLSLDAPPRPVGLPVGLSHVSGAIRVEDKLFVATANLLGGVYGLGALVVYDLAQDGAILDHTRRSYATSGNNATSLVRLANGLLLVLSSGDRTPNSEAFLDWFDPDLESKQGTLFLGQMKAQLMGQIAVEGSLALIGTAGELTDDSGSILKVDVNTRQVLSSVVLPETKYHSSILIRGGRAFVTDFNTGLVSILDLLTLGTLQVLDFRNDLGIPKVNDLGKPINAEAGPAIFVGNAFVQTFAQSAAVYVEKPV